MGKKIKIARIKLGLKAQEVAKKCEISYTYYSKLENEKVKNPSRETMIKISKALGISVQELFFSDEEEENKQN